MSTSWFRMIGLSAIAAVALAEPIITHAQSAEPELYPVSSVIYDKKHYLTYPSVAGSFLVYNENHMDQFSVVRVPVDQVDVIGKRVDATMLNEVLRQGVALAGGGIGFVSNRIGPVSAWFWPGRGDSQVAIANMALFRGGLLPEHLSASADAGVWCFDATLQKIRHNQLLNEFVKPSNHELLGQEWRIYNSNFVAYKMSYQDSKAGLRNKLHSPSLFIFKRHNSELSMLPNAFDGAISADGKKLVFVREVKGNYDLWLQNMDGSGLTQLTTGIYGEFEPAFSPDGKRIAFVSNRDSQGNVRHTSIYVMDIQNGEVTRVTNTAHASDGGVTWKDNQNLIFHSNRALKKPQSKTVSDWNIWQVSLR